MPVVLTIAAFCFHSTNLEGMTAMDIAVLTNHVPMINVLSKYGARATLLGNTREALYYIAG